MSEDQRQINGIVRPVPFRDNNNSSNNASFLPVHHSFTEKHKSNTLTATKDEIMEDVALTHGHMDMSFGTVQREMSAADMPHGDNSPSHHYSREMGHVHNDSANFNHNDDRSLCIPSRIEKQNGFVTFNPSSNLFKPLATNNNEVHHHHTNSRSSFTTIENNHLHHFNDGVESRIHTYDNSETGSFSFRSPLQTYQYTFPPIEQEPSSPEHFDEEEYNDNDYDYNEANESEYDEDDDEIDTTPLSSFFRTGRHSQQAQGRGSSNSNGICISPFQPIVSDRSWPSHSQGGISPLPTNEYEAWLVQRRDEQKRHVIPVTPTSITTIGSDVSSQSSSCYNGPTLMGKGCNNDNHLNNQFYNQYRQKDYQKMNSLGCKKEEENEHSSMFRPVSATPSDHDTSNYK